MRNSDRLLLYVQALDVERSCYSVPEQLYVAAFFPDSLPYLSLLHGNKDIGLTLFPVNNNLPDFEPVKNVLHEGYQIPGRFGHENVLVDVLPEFCDYVWVPLE